jgi:muramoyltetrapeptide carboxypeptidase
VGIAAPAGSVDEGDLAGAHELFRRLGYGVRQGRALFRKERFMAGPDRARADDLMDLFLDRDVRAIFCARGGYGSMRLLDLLDYDAIAADPKILVGFSDTTALQLALLAGSRLITYSGVTLAADLREGRLDPLIETSLHAVLSGAKPEIGELTPLRSGVAEGPLIGGCLSLVVSLLGTPYMPDLANALLILEETREEPYRVDRMLTQLRLTGALDNVAAIIMGGFRECTARDPRDGSIDEVIADLASAVHCPVYRDLPYGHGKSRCVLPLGVHARLEHDSLQFAKP